MTSLTRLQVEDIFLGRSHIFPGGEAAEPIDQPDGSSIRDEFYFRVSAKSPAQVKAHWSKMIFTGKGQPPRELDTREIKALLREHPKFIAYIESRAVDDDLRVVFSP